MNIGRKMLILEKYLLFILLSAPGFISKRVSECLGDTPPKRGEFESVMVYCSYSMFSASLTLLVAWGMGLYSDKESWTVLENNFIYPWFCLRFFILSLVCSIIVGASWQLLIEKKLLLLFNWINEKLKSNHVFLEGTLLHKIINDGKDHFLVVEREDKEIAIGFFRGASSATSERTELYLASHPDYMKWLEYARTQDKNHVLNKVKGVYLDLDSNTIIRELEFPPEFLISSGQVESVETVESEAAAAKSAL